jgi:hypothetical protein
LVVRKAAKLAVYEEIKINAKNHLCLPEIIEKKNKINFKNFNKPNSN